MKAFWALGSALLLAVVLPASEAQLPQQTPLVQVSVQALQGSAVVERLVPVSIPFVVKDLSQDPGTAANPHIVRLRAEIMEAERNGWSVTISPNFVPTLTGDEVAGTLTIAADAAVQNPYIHVRMTATMQAVDPTTGGAVSEFTSEDIVAAQLAPYYASLVQISARPERTGPFQPVVYPVTIQNLGPYPDAYVIRVRVDRPGYAVSIQPNVVLYPGEIRNVPLTVLTPRDKVYFAGEMGTITVEVRSENDPGVVYTANTVVIVEGVYVPGYWWPLILLAVVLSGPLAYRGMDRLHRHTKEDGRPRRGFAPEERAELAALRIQDPEAYKERRAKLAAIQRSRWEVWREQHRKKRAIERAMMVRQREEARRLLQTERGIESQRRKLERERAVRLAAQLKVEREHERAAEKARRKDEKRLAKRARKEGKRLAKLEKRRAKEAAKLANKKEKLEAKLARQREKELRAIEKEKLRRVKDLERERRRREKGT